jgi:hypothetical protein
MNSKDLTNEQIAKVAESLLVGGATIEDLPIGIISNVKTSEESRYWSPFDLASYYDKKDPGEQLVRMTLDVTFTGRVKELAHIFNMKKVSFIPREDK